MPMYLFLRPLRLNMLAKVDVEVKSQDYWLLACFATRNLSPAISKLGSELENGVTRTRFCTVFLGAC